MSEIIGVASNKSCGSNSSAPVDFLGSMADSASLTTNPEKSLRENFGVLGLSWTEILGDVPEAPKRWPAVTKCSLKTLHRSFLFENVDESVMICLGRDED